MALNDFDRMWGAFLRELITPEVASVIRRARLAITEDGKPRVDRAHGTLATEAMPVFDLTQIDPTDGAPYDTAHDQIASVASAYVPGGTDVAIADGGTGSSTASGARTNLGAAPTVGPTFTGTITSGGSDTDTTIVQGHDRHKSAAPSVAVGAALGSGGSVAASLVGTDQVGKITLVAGTTSLTSGTAGTVTFATARPNTQYEVVLTPENANAGVNAVQARSPGGTTTTWTIAFSVAPSSGFTYIYHYHVREWTN